MRSVYRSFCAGAFALIAVSASAESTFSLTSLTPDVALKLATAARESCNEQGYQVAVAVVDRSGLLQAFVRDRFATPHTVEVAERKAWTALSFRIPTSEMEKATNQETTMMGIRHASNALMVGGG
ncbi:heme-binding protein, partial [Litorivicinus sp.]|nr:heme-binding protein [Litorivicinus sp.]